MRTVYVLYSPSFNKIYIGYTINIEERLKSHNYLTTKGYTIKYRAWEVVYKECYKSEALKREKQLKTAKGREFIWNKINRI
jgi:putative endonuclease